MTTDLNSRQVYRGFDHPSLVIQAGDSSVKAISFHLDDLNVDTGMNVAPAFYAAALDQLASADGVIELVWRMNDFGANGNMESSVFYDNSGRPLNDPSGSQGVGGWAGLFKFSVKDVSEGTLDPAGDTINQIDSLKGACVQENVNDGSANMQVNGYWPVELNVMRGIVTQQNTGAGEPFNNMHALPTNAGFPTADSSNASVAQYSAAEHYFNYVGKEITGARAGSQLFDNAENILNHLISEDGVSTSDSGAITDVSGVQRMIWEQIHSVLTNSDNKDPSSNNIATKLVRHMLDPTIVDTSTNVALMRNRFFGGSTDPSSGHTGGTKTTFKRFGPDGRECSGVMVGVNFMDDHSTFVDVPLAHGDVLEFNLTLRGANNTSDDGVPGGSGTTSRLGIGVNADVSGSNSGTSEEVQPTSASGQSTVHIGGGNGVTDHDRFGGLLPGTNAIRDVTYRVRVHLEGVDQRS
jgi:hypothetical protein